MEGRTEEPVFPKRFMPTMPTISGTVKQHVAAAPPTCRSCGSSLRGRWERLTPGLCRTLIKFYAGICAKGKNELHLKELDLSNSEYNNFQKLRYFALAAKIEHRPGWWLLTWKGRGFVRNELRVHQRVYIFQNQIRERSRETVSIAEALRTEPYWLVRDDFLSPGPIPARQEGLF